MTLAVHLGLLALAIPSVLATAYLLLLVALSRAPRRPPPSTRRLRFDVIVPAHNEALGIAAVIASLGRMDWPVDGFRVMVVADNCTDSTAARARAAGARVLERRDRTHRGKGHALATAFEVSRAGTWADAVVVVDADSIVSRNLLEACAVRIEHGQPAIQAYHRVRNLHDSWRTRLLAIAMAAFHCVRSRAREHLRLSCGIRGNGWCVTHRLLEEVPYRAFSLAEDVEYGVDLGLAGRRVSHADEAWVASTMVTSERAARSQRLRWESGRWQLIRSRLLPLLKAAGSGPSRICADLALDLLVPPLTYIVLLAGLLSGGAAVAALWMPSALPWLWLGLGCMAGVTVYVLRGWQLSGTGYRGLVDLARAPVYMLWKVVLVLFARSPVQWVRTRREPR